MLKSNTFEQKQQNFDKKMEDYRKRQIKQPKIVEMKKERRAIINAEFRHFLFKPEKYIAPR